MIRDCFGRILASKATVHNNVNSVFSVEALACTEGIMMGMQLGLRRFIIEGDSLTDIKKIRSDSQDRSKICLHIRDIKSLINSFRSGRFTHVNREVNGVANSIARECLKKGKGFFIPQSMPRSVEKMVFDVGT